MGIFTKRIIIGIASATMVLGLSACAPDKEQNASNIVELEQRGFDTPAFYQHEPGVFTSYTVGIGDLGCRIVLTKEPHRWRYGNYTDDMSAAIIEANAENIGLDTCFSSAER